MAHRPTLLINGQVLTMDSAMAVHDPGFVLIENDKIKAIGGGTPPPVADAEVTDLHGDIVMPGMVNTHCHMPMTLFRGLAEDKNDRLFRYILPMERKFVSPEMVRIGARAAALEMIAGGVTTVADMYYFETEIGHVIDRAGMRGVVGQTIADFAAPDAADMDAAFDRCAELAETFAGHPRVTASLAPHAPYSTGLDVLRRVAAMAERTGLPVQIHLAEMDSEMDWVQQHYGTRPVDLVQRAGLLQPWLIAAHCLHVNEAEIELLAGSGVKVAHNGRSNAKAGRGVAPVMAMRQAGVPVGIGTDGPMSGNRLDLFSQFSHISNYQKLLAHSRDALRSIDICRMATVEGARVLGLDDRIGSLEPGKLADLVRIDLRGTHLLPNYDPYATIVYAAMASDVRDVMVAGAWLMRDRQVLTLDRDQVHADALALAEDFREEALRLSR